MNFAELVNRVLTECNMAGGVGSVFGANVTSTATPFSGDAYAPGDARRPKSLHGGVMTRGGLKKKRKRNKKR